MSYTFIALHEDPVSICSRIGVVWDLITSFILDISCVVIVSIFANRNILFNINLSKQFSTIQFKKLALNCNSYV